MLNSDRPANHVVHVTLVDSGDTTVPAVVPVVLFSPKRSHNFVVEKDGWLDEHGLKHGESSSHEFRPILIGAEEFLGCRQLPSPWRLIF